MSRIILPVMYSLAHVALGCGGQLVAAMTARSPVHRLGVGQRAHLFVQPAFPPLHPVGRSYCIKCRTMTTKE
ncbi:MAG: hypothetical protein E6J34_13560 [Chloroflexi bacterium]|nr:MAG: hypothetical protein E6J34_13560 [Chloroflexota bacterium]